jgi:alpha-D-ribose 1-methylphosphonate 5-triphosphate diphosphatase PhnM
VDEEQIVAAIAEAEGDNYTIELDRVDRMFRVARESGVILASHDDRSRSRFRPG